MTVSSSTRKAGPYIGAGTTSTFPFSFKVFQASDVLVVRLNTATNVETTLALTTNYTVSLNGDQDNSPGGNITLVGGALATGFNLVISSKVPYTQGTDITNMGGFYPEVIEDALDKATIEIQQIKEQVDRSAKLPITSTEDADALVADLIRLADSADNIDTVAGSIGNVNTVAADIADVNTVAGSIASVNTVSADIAAVNTVAADLNEPVSEIETVAGSIGNVNTVGGAIANVNTVATDIANVNAVAGNKTNIDAVAGNATNINAVNANKTNIDAVNANKANIDAVAGNATNINAVNANKANIDTAVANMPAIIAAPTEAANAAASAAAAAASAASGMYSAVQDKSADYTVVVGDAGDLIRMTTSGGARTVTLPAISTLPDGFNVTVVKWTGDANAVTVQRSGTDLINGSTSYVLDAQYKSATFVADKESSTWFASGSGSSSTNIVVDPFTGNGSTTAFTLSGDPGSKNNTLVSIGGSFQLKSAYTLSGSTITFSAAPPNGVAFEVQWSQPLAIGTPADGTVSTVKLADSALAATPTGLAKMADGFFTATTAALAKFADGFLAATATGRAKMADLFVTTAKLDNGVLSTDTAGRAKMADGFITAAKLASGVPLRSQLPAGTVLQVVQATLTSAFSTSSGTNSPASTGLSTSITPTSATSKILVMVNLGQVSSNTDSTWGAFLFRDATKIYFGDLQGTADQGSVAGGLRTASGYGFIGNPASFSYVDSPATTASISYSVKLGGNGGATIYLNIDGRQVKTANNLTTTPSSIILMEIAA